MAAGESGSEDCRTLVSIQRVAALNSFNVQRSPKLQCNSIFPTSRRFCTNERGRFLYRRNVAVTLREPNWRTAYWIFINPVSSSFSSHDVWTTDSHVVWPLLSLRNTHSGAFTMVVLSSTRWSWKPSKMVHSFDFYRCGTTNHKVPSTSSMENSWSPFRWQYASPFVRADVPCQFLIKFTFPNQFVRDHLNDLNYNSFSCMYREGSIEADCQHVLYRRQYKRT